MENAILEKRVEKCENRIDDLSEKVTENVVNMSYIQRIVDKFEKFTEECTQTLVNLRMDTQTLSVNYESLNKKVCDIEEKVEENEDLTTIDLRKNQKKTYENILGKIGLILTPLAFIAFILYLIFQ